MKKTKKKKTINITIFVIIGIVLVMLVGLVINKDLVVYKGINLNEPEKDLDFSVFVDNLNNADKKDIFILTLFTDTKTDATLYKDMVQKIHEDYKFDNHYIYYTNEMTVEENADLAEILGGGVNAYPMTFVLQDKKVIGSIWGYHLEGSYLDELSNIIKLEDYLRNNDNAFFYED